MCKVPTGCSELVPTGRPSQGTQSETHSEYPVGLVPAGALGRAEHRLGTVPTGCSELVPAGQAEPELTPKGANQMFGVSFSAQLGALVGTNSEHPVGQPSRERKQEKWKLTPNIQPALASGAGELTPNLPRHSAG